GRGGIQPRKRARADVEINPAGRQELRIVDLRAPHPQRDVEPMAPVDPRGDRLIETAMLRLRLPVRGERHLVEGYAGCAPEDRGGEEHRKQETEERKR